MFSNLFFISWQSDRGTPLAAPLIISGLLNIKETFFISKKNDYICLNQLTNKIWQSLEKHQKD